MSVRDITFYEGSVPALTMVGSKLITVASAVFCFSPSVLFRAMAKGKAQVKAKHVQKASNINFVTSVSANGLQICCRE